MEERTVVVEDVFSVYENRGNQFRYKERAEGKWTNRQQMSRPSP